MNLKKQAKKKIKIQKKAKRVQKIKKVLQVQAAVAHQAPQAQRNLKKRAKNRINQRVRINHKKAPRLNLTKMMIQMLKKNKKKIFTILIKNLWHN